MKSNKYAALDEAIVAAIRGGDSCFTAISLRMSVCIAARNASPDGYEDRTIDGRLQALRKRGVIAYAKGKWEVVA